MLWAAMLFAALGGEPGRNVPASDPPAVLQRYEQSQIHMATTVKLVLYAPNDAAARRGADAAFARVAELNRILSDYSEVSELSLLCQKAGGPPIVIGPELFAVLERSQYWSERTDGAFDVTLGPVIRLWRRAGKLHVMPDPKQLAEARKLVGRDNLRLDPAGRTAQLLLPKMQLDVGGIAKGYAGDEVLKVLAAMGLTHALIALGGDVVVGDPPPGEAGWKVAIAALDDRDRSLPWELILANRAVSTSGDASQFASIKGKRYSHIIDPSSGMGLTQRRQTTVVARRGVDSDALDTACNVLGPERFAKVLDATDDAAGFFLWLDEKGTVHSSATRRWADVKKTTRTAAAESGSRKRR